MYKSGNLLNEYYFIFSEFLKSWNSWRCNQWTIRFSLSLSAPSSICPYRFDISLRFRIGRIGLVGDIKKVFLQISIDEIHQNYLRLKWFDDVNSLLPKTKILRFPHLVFGLFVNPFIVHGRVKFHLENRKFWCILMFICRCYDWQFYQCRQRTWIFWHCKVQHDEWEFWIVEMGF